MLVGLCCSSNIVVLRPPAGPGQIAVAARPLQAKPGTESSESVWKAALRLKRTLHKTDRDFANKDNYVFWHCYNTVLIQYFWIKIAHFIPASCSQVPTQCRCEGRAMLNLRPTVKSGPHQTWSCPQHASRISLFVLQMLSCLGWMGSIVGFFFLP